MQGYCEAQENQVMISKKEPGVKLMLFIVFNIDGF